MTRGHAGAGAVQGALSASFHLKTKRRLGAVWFYGT
jgi:hypothetical protein